MQGRIRRHIVRQPQLVDAEPLRRLGDLRRGARIRRELRETVFVHAHSGGIPRGADRVRKLHDLPGIGRIRWGGISRRPGAGECPQPLPTCRHRGCPLAEAGFGAQPMPYRNTRPRPPAPARQPRDTPASPTAAPPPSPPRTTPPTSPVPPRPTPRQLAVRSPTGRPTTATPSTFGRLTLPHLRRGDPQYHGDSGRESTTMSTTARHHHSAAA